MTAIMKATVRNGRATANGKVYNANHNTRAETRALERHIDHDRTEQNINIQFTNEGQVRRCGSFDAKSFELSRYEHLYGTGQEAKNARYIQDGHPDRCKTIKEYNMNEKTPQTTETAHQELAALQAEIETLRAKKSIAECIRETISADSPIKPLKRKVRKAKGRTGTPIVEVTLLETDYQQLVKMAQSAAWITRKLAELQHLGDKLWHKLNQSAALQEAIQRAETAEMRCRSLEQQLSQVRTQAIYDLDDGADREIDPFTRDDREID